MVEAILPRTYTPKLTICAPFAAFQGAVAGFVHVSEISNAAKLTRPERPGLAGGRAPVR